jgi:hypothetical protein
MKPEAHANGRNKAKAASPQSSTKSYKLKTL